MMSQLHKDKNRFQLVAGLISSEYGVEITFGRRPFYFSSFSSRPGAKTKTKSWLHSQSLQFEY